VSVEPIWKIQTSIRVAPGHPVSNPPEDIASEEVGFVKGRGEGLPAEIPADCDRADGSSSRVVNAVGQVELSLRCGRIACVDRPFTRPGREANHSSRWTYPRSPLTRGRSGGW